MQSHPIPTVNGSSTPAPAPATPPKTEIAVILDRSGSMEAIATDAIGGFNAFVATQRSLPPTPSSASRSPHPQAAAGGSDNGGEGPQPDDARLTLVLFDDRYEVPIKSAPLGQVPLLTRQTFVPRGSTALLDAIGRTIKKMTESFAARPATTRPDTIIVAILTDGEENASSRFTQAHIADLIAEKRAQGWQFVFLAANQDAIASAVRLNIPRADADNFTADAAGAQAVFSTLSQRVTEKRGR
jgi:hypothetical protein